MRQKMRDLLVIVVGLMILPVTARSQQIQTLVVSGHTGSVPVTQMNGRHYVEVEAVARLVNGSMSFGRTQITLTLTEAAGSSGVTATEVATSPEATLEFSREFLRAGIEAMSTIREWHSALASAIQNQYPVHQEGLAQYQTQAETTLRLAQTAAAKDADKKAAQLITNEYQNMRQLSDKYVAKRANMSYIAPDALKNDALNQNLVTCGKSLGAMAADGHFFDEVTCR